MGNEALILIQNVSANYVEKRMQNTGVKQRLVMLALEHPNVLKGLFKTRHYYMVTRRLISGTVVDARNVLKLSKRHGVIGKR